MIGVAIATGLSLNFLHIDPVKALYWSAILNGLVAAPLMAVIMMMASNPKVMGKFVIPGLSEMGRVECYGRDALCLSRRRTQLEGLSGPKGNPIALFTGFPFVRMY